MFSFVLVSHPSCTVFRYFALYLEPALSVFVCVFLYWVRPLVMLLTFAASAFMVGVHLIGCVLRRLIRTLTSVPEREDKKIFPTGFFGCVPFRAPHQTLASVLWKGSQRRSLGEGDTVG